VFRFSNSKSNLFYDWRSISQYVLGLVTRCYFLSEGFRLKVAVLFLWGALSDERTGLQFAVQSPIGPRRAEPLTKLYSLIWDSPNLEGQVPVFISPRNRAAQLYPLRRLLRLAGLRWRYSNPPPHGFCFVSDAYRKFYVLPLRWWGDSCNKRRPFSYFRKLE
jgi:hypothetical protein